MRQLTIRPWLRLTALPLTALLLTGLLLPCASSATPLPAARDGGTANTSAATQTAREGVHCKALGDFYWEIGDGKGAVVSGMVGDDYASTTTMRIASASKWVWGSYVLEKLGKHRDPDGQVLAALEMRSGHTAFNACLLAPTVGGCYRNRANSKLNPADVGRFFYNAGHDQWLAMEFGLARMDSAALTREVLGQLGNNLAISYWRPVPAGGMRGSPAGYAAFLRKIINGELRMQQYLGYQPVCTLPSVCPTAASSPAREAWHYSLNHWIEDDPRTGDGSFSSPGLEGFYPWISADKTTYGIVARETLTRSAYWESVLCGRDIRKAYFSGTPAP